MNILVIGSGGREHALFWKLSESPQTERIYAIPGNPGMGEMTDIAVTDNAAILQFAKEKDIGLVVVCLWPPCKRSRDRGLEIVCEGSHEEVRDSNCPL